MATTPPDEVSIITNSPSDRLIGMLLERLEMMRDLHQTMIAEGADQRKETGNMQVMLATLVARVEAHDRADVLAFKAVSASHEMLVSRMDALTTAVTSATTAGLIAKSQIAAGWKVIAVIGALAMGTIGIFATFFNHKWS